VADGLAQADVVFDAYWQLTDASGTDVAQSVRTASTPPLNQYEADYEGLEGGFCLAKYVAGQWSELVLNPLGQPQVTNAWVRITVEIAGTTMRALRNGVALVPVSGTADVGAEISSGSVGFRATTVAAGQAVWIDDLRVRSLVLPEPTVSLAPEESAPFSR
jgi:hypothetical protein